MVTPATMLRQVAEYLRQFSSFAGDRGPWAELAQDRREYWTKHAIKLVAILGDPE